jgi:catechol 2,3-dioxygenase-like lactoylglutathione lyase family enzyme
MRMAYVMKFVSDMDAAVAFYRDTLGLPLKFQTPGWSEFATGETTLALHIASAENSAGACELGFSVEDIQAFHAAKSAEGMVFPRPPKEEHGVMLATFLDCEGAPVSVSG